MSDSKFTIEQFRILAQEGFSFLEGRGFLRALHLEQTSPTVGTVVYMGKNVSFIFSLDVRDQCVDAEVVRVRNGLLKRNWEGGYSSNIYTHLVNHTGYRGSPSGSSKRAASKVGESVLQRMIDGWVGLLKEAGESLLQDSCDSVP